MTRVPRSRGWPPGRSRRPPAGDRGRISVFLAVAFGGLLLVFGVAVDVTGQLRALMRAQNIAAEAARTGGQAVDSPEAMISGGAVVDAALAAEYADAYLSRSLPELGQQYQREPVEVVEDGTAIRVTVTLVYEPQILNLFGIDEVPVTASSTANLVTG